MSCRGANGGPGSLELIRRIRLASSSAPGAFPPILIKVEIDGKQYDEVHVDGGVTRSPISTPVRSISERYASC